MLKFNLFFKSIKLLQFMISDEPMAEDFMML